MLLWCGCSELQDSAEPRDTSPRDPVVATDTADQPEAFTVGLQLPLDAGSYGTGSAQLSFLRDGQLVCSWSGSTDSNLEITLIASDCSDPIANWSTELMVKDGVGHLALPTWPSGVQFVPTGPASEDDDLLVVEPMYALDLRALGSAG